MKTKLGDLDSHLFAALERLADEDMTAEQIETEVKRATAVVAVADAVIANADTKLRAARLFAEHGATVLPMLPQISGACEISSPEVEK